MGEHWRAVLRGYLGLMIALLIVSPGEAEGPFVMRDVTAQSGITFVHTDGSSGRRYIVETVASGLATFDFDADGLIDIYFLNGAPLLGTEIGPNGPPRNRLYRNNGDWTFSDVTDQAGVGDPGYGLGVAVADFDNDGFPDLYVSNFGANVMYRNNGDGTFTETSRHAGTAAADERKVGAGVCFLDIDGNGLLDLFVANYLEFGVEMHVRNVRMGVPIYVGPERYPPLPAILYRNNGDGTFTDISQQSGIGALPGPGMGIICLDHNGNGHTDIFVGNDGGPGNFLFVNDGQGRFEEVAILSGLAFSAAGLAHGSMGVDSGDYDHDGLFDLFVTSYQRQPATLFRNLGDGLFDDVTNLTGASQGSLNTVKWGCGFIDFDNNGHRDLFVACGHLLDNVEEFDDTTSYHARNVLLQNNGQGRFVDVSDRSGDGLNVRLSSRGAAFDDLDNDGRIDVVILNSRREPTILRNASLSGNWLQVQLRGVTANRDGVGSRVKVVAGDSTQVAEVHSGRGYQSHFGSRLHFGVGPRTVIDRVEVHWSDGGQDVFENLEVNQTVTLREGTGRP
jgi:enediyne biosynthesis protein E4